MGTSSKVQLTDSYQAIATNGTFIIQNTDGARIGWIVALTSTPPTTDTPHFFSSDKDITDKVKVSSLESWYVKLIDVKKASVGLIEAD